MQSTGTGTGPGAGASADGWKRTADDKRLPASSFFPLKKKKKNDSRVTSTRNDTQKIERHIVHVNFIPEKSLIKTSEISTGAGLLYPVTSRPPGQLRLSLDCLE